MMPTVGRVELLWSMRISQNRGYNFHDGNFLTNEEPTHPRVSCGNKGMTMVRRRLKHTLEKTLTPPQSCAGSPSHLSTQPRFILRKRCQPHGSTFAETHFAGRTHWHHASRITITPKKSRKSLNMNDFSHKMLRSNEFANRFLTRYLP